MFQSKLSKEFAIAVAVILVIWLLEPYKLFTGDEAKREDTESSYHHALDERQESVASSLARLNVPDQNLFACIKSAADERAKIHPNSTGGIDDVRELKNLYCPRQNISSIKGIAQLPELEFLDISYNRVDDLSELDANSSLRTLRLQGNPIEDVGALKKMTALADVTLPELPQIRCDDIRKIIGDIRSNIDSTRCYKNTKSENGIARRVEVKEEDVDQEEDSYKLDSHEEQELIDYEYDLKRRFD